MSNNILCNSKIKLSDIIVPENFLNSIPKADKVTEHFKYYIKNQQLKKPITITRNNKLQDGYISWLVAKSARLDEVEVKYM